MKLALSIFLFVALLTSCGSSNNFTKRKYLNLDSNKSNSLDISKEIDSPECDTIWLKNGAIILAEIIEEKKNSVWYYKCSAQKGYDTLDVNAELIEEKIDSIQGIRYDEKEAKEEGQKKVSKNRIIGGSILFVVSGVALGHTSTNENFQQGFGKNEGLNTLLYTLLLLTIVGLLIIFLGLSWKYNWFKKKK